MGSRPRAGPPTWFLAHPRSSPRRLGPVEPSGRRVLIVGDRRRRGVAEGVRRHLPFLERTLDVVGVDLEEEVDLSQADVDLVLVFGGDGSILHVARRIGLNTVPILGVNYGRFGFLADVLPDDLEQGIHAWLEGEASESLRARMRVRFLEAAEPETAPEVTGEVLAFNDVVLGRNGVGRMVDIDVRIDGRVAIQYSGDGLILATATGSTAHAMAAGGPLLDPTVNGFVMVPIAPHSLATRPVVLSGRHKIELAVSGTRGRAAVTVDGAPAVDIGAQHRIQVEDADAPVRLLRVSRRPFYDALREKLGWRGRPRYRPGQNPGAMPDAGVEDETSA